MAIKIAPKNIQPVASAEKLLSKIRKVRKPTGKAKEAVTLRLSKECVSYFQREFGDEWRTQMQHAIENAHPKPASS